MCCADPDAAPWEAAAPRTAETVRPLDNNHVSAPLRALIEQGLLADRFEDRLAPEQAYLRALDLQMCGGEGVQRAREAAAAAAAAAPPIDPMAAAVRQLISMMGGGEEEQRRGLQRTASTPLVPSVEAARTAIAATEGRDGYDIGAAWSMLCDQHERQQQLERAEAAAAPPAAPDAAALDAADPLVVAELVSWGFSVDAVEAALAAAGGVKQAAVEILVMIGELPPDS